MAQTNNTKQTVLRFHPSALLLAAQLLLLVLYAVFDGLHSERAILSAFSIVILMLVVWVVQRSPAVNWVAWILALPVFILNLLSAQTLDPNLIAWTALLEGILYFYGAGSLIAYMLGDTEVTTDELFAAGATYTLLAWGFAYFYLACQTWIPGSIISTVTSGRALTFVELLFLSFTNLSSTGLSDIVPVTTLSRVIVMLEQFAGVGYIAIVVSRLIGMSLQRKTAKKG